MPNFTFFSKPKKTIQRKLLPFTSKALCKNFFIVFVLLFIYQDSISQTIASYGFKASTETFNSIESTGNSVALEYGNLDNGYKNGLLIGFSFSFNNVSSDYFNISTNGLITLGTATTAKFTNNSLNANSLTGVAKKPIIAPLWDDLNLHNVQGQPQGSMKYLTTGVAPNQVLTIQWSNIEWPVGNSPLISFQIKLYQTSNTIQFIYSAGGAIPQLALSSASVGIAGTGTGSSNIRSVNQFSTGATSLPNIAEVILPGTTTPKYPATGLAFTYYPPITGKNWIGAGNIGKGTDFNAPENWNPAGTPDDKDDCIMDINNFALVTAPSATLSADATIKSLAITFTGAGSTARTFNLNTDVRNFTINNNLSLKNASSSGSGHTLSFNVDSGTTTIIGSDQTNTVTVLIIQNTCSSGTTNCGTNFNNSGNATINGITSSTSFNSSTGKITFNVDNLPSLPYALTTFNGDANFDDGGVSVNGSTILISGIPNGGNKTGQMAFNGNVYFGAHALSNSTNLFGQVIFDGTNNQIQALTVNTNSLYFPAVVVGSTNAPIVTLNGSYNAKISSFFLTSATGLTINGNSVLDLKNKTLNLSTFTTGIGKLSIPVTGTLKCGGISGGAGSNFPDNFSTYSLSANSTTEYSYSTANQIIASQPTNHSNVNINYGKLTLSGGYSKILSNNIVANGVITLNGSTNLDLNDKTLTANKTFSLPGTGVLIGSQLSGIISKGNGTIKFDQTTGTDNNYLKILTVNSGKLTLGNALNIAAGTDSVDASSNGDYGTVTVNGTTTTLATQGYLTLKSIARDIDARIAQSTGTIKDSVTVERFIPGVRTWRLITVPFSSSTQTINQAWQEGAKPYPSADNTNYVNNPVYDPYPGNDTTPGYGTEITYSSDPNTVDSGFDVGVNSASLLTWNYGIKSYVSVPNTTTLKITNGAYYLFVRGDRRVNISQGIYAPHNNTVLRAKGILQRDFSVWYPHPGALYFFLGNPYASSIDLTNFFVDNPGVINKRFTTWQASRSGTYDVGRYVYHEMDVQSPYDDLHDSLIDSKIIQSGEAFYLTSTGDTITNSIMFKESYKTAHAPDNTFSPFGPATQMQVNTASSPLPRVYVNLRTPSDSSFLLDGSVCIISDTFSTADNSYDITKSISSTPALTILKNSKNLAIQATPFPQPSGDPDVPPILSEIGIYSPGTGSQNFYLAIRPGYMPNLANSALYLYDKYLGQFTLLSQTGITRYSFTTNSADPTSFNNRFNIQYYDYSNPGLIRSSKDSLLAQANSKKLTIGSVSASPNPVNNGIVNLKFTKMPKGSYNIVLYSMNGTKVIEKNLNHSGGDYSYPLSFGNTSNGIYRVKVFNRETKEFNVVSILVINK